MGDPYQCDYAKPPSLFSLVYPTQRCTIGIPEPQASRHRVKLLSLMIAVLVGLHRHLARFAGIWTCIY